MRKHNARVAVRLVSSSGMTNVSRTQKYEAWTFNDAVPGPMIRAKVGDVLEISHLNADPNGIAHNIDFHCGTIDFMCPCRFIYVFVIVAVFC